MADLVARFPFAERSSALDVILFGTTAAEPHEAEGFYPERVEADGDRYRWAGQEAEVSINFPRVAPRAAVLDVKAYVKSQQVRVSLNEQAVATIAVDDLRRRYLVPLPAPAQKTGENRLRFAFAKAAAPADRDPKSQDRRPLSAAFYSLAVGPENEGALLDLVRSGAPPPFSVDAGSGGVQSLVQAGPSAVRYAFRLPTAAELRFTPALHPGARSSGGSAALRIMLEADDGDPPRELWRGVPDPRDRNESGEVVVALPGEPGAVVRLSLNVEGGPFAWGLWRGPRVLGRGVAGPLAASAWSAEDARRGDALRQSLQGMNVVFVILDAARAAEFGCYGYGRPTTPEVDRVAREGVMFESAFTPAVHTQGAMASVWTSQEPDRHHGAVTFRAPLPSDRLTLAELLSANGVRTAGFVANAVAGSAFGFDRGFSEFHEVFRQFPELGSRGDAFRRVLPDWLRANKDRRFFAYVHFREPHFPYDPPPPFDTRFGPEGPIRKRDRREMAWITDVNQGRRALSADERDHLQRLYDGNLAFADREVGVLLRSLSEMGLLDRTVVIIAADHGEQIHEHGWIGHNVQLYEQSVHVPLIVRFPAGRGPAGRRVASLVDLLDVAPTVADVFGVLGRGGSDRAFQGRSLLPVIGGAPGKGAVLSRTVWDRPIYAMRDERFKYLYHTRTGEEWLFDLRGDPGEAHDLHASQPVRAAYYRQALHEWLARVARSAVLPAEGRHLTPEQCENLKALGYVVAECR